MDDLSKKRRLLIGGLAVVGLLALPLAGCPKKGPGERAGETVDNAVDRAGDTVEDVGEAVDDTARDAVDAVDGD